jgi:hypothetical protein
VLQVRPQHAGSVVPPHAQHQRLVVVVLTAVAPREARALEDVRGGVAGSEVE